MTDDETFAEFRPSGNTEAEDDDLVIEEPPPPKRPSRHEVSAAIDVLHTFSLFLSTDHFAEFKSGVEKLTNIVDRNRIDGQRQIFVTDFFSIKS